MTLGSAVTAGAIVWFRLSRGSSSSTGSSSADSPQYINTTMSPSAKTGRWGLPLEVGDIVESATAHEPLATRRERRVAERRAEEEEAEALVEARAAKAAKAAGVAAPLRFNGGSFIADAVEGVMDSVVNITLETESSTAFTRRSLVSSGSGFFIDPDGTILTNAHVVSDGTEDSKMSVTTWDGRVHKGIVHSLDAKSDLAVVKIVQDPTKPKEHWPAVRLGASQDLRAGDWVMAIGSPFGLQNTVTAGIISSGRRRSSEIGGRDSSVEYLQTDCVIHSGSSGGPLINLHGEVVGINTTRAESEGISFAIRVDSSLNIIHQLVQKGFVQRPWLGLKLVSLSPHVWQQLRSKGPDEFLPKVKHGVLITSIFPRSPAGIAGCLEGDVIVAVNNTPVSATSEIYKIIGKKIGEPIKLTLKRHVPVDMDWDGRARTFELVQININVTVEEMDADHKSLFT
ncbi:hypothetical protein HK101_005787 [Irineochytrium annulatum]|nr:hypothetical protein HK101_005787 [Irineochytrium annulatum]